MHEAIQAVLDPTGLDAHRRVSFVEDPAMRGSQACRDMDLRHTLGLMAALVFKTGIGALGLGLQMP